MAHQSVSCKVVYEWLGEWSELAGASFVIALINRAFVLSVELILLSVHCDFIELFDFGIELSRAICQGNGREEMRDVGTGCVVILNFVCV